MTLPGRRLRLAFFGTPDIAKTVLAGLIEADEDDLVLVVSQPDRPKGRGKKLEPTPVKALALEASIPVEQPRKLRDGVLAAQLKSMNVDLAIVVAYGRILPADVFRAPEFETWNVHASLLPRLRGASPIQHAILEGEAETGVTLMRLAEGMDEGDMLLQRQLPIAPTDTGGQLTQHLAELGAKTAVEGLRLSKTEGLTITPQDSTAATYAGLLEKNDGQLSFSNAAARLDRQVRAFDPWPGTFVPLPDGQPLKIRKIALAGAGDPQQAPGTVIETQPRLVVQTGDGALELIEVQPPGKRTMSAGDYLRGAGRHITIGNIIGVN